MTQLQAEKIEESKNSLLTRRFKSF